MGPDRVPDLSKCPRGGIVNFCFGGGVFPSANKQYFAVREQGRRVHGIPIAHEASKAERVGDGIIDFSYSRAATAKITPGDQDPAIRE